ncbi:Hypothetical predicted protein [Paramuricea clavata]|uniref:Uncharacterized protein n=1 Tax=Paramuricea clavata TaxID=317549 RepID=A0A6S7H3T2_PARCT|nr:Hypothetical predicted protein [Paramuricea clavata]
MINGYLIASENHISDDALSTRRTDCFRGWNWTEFKDLEPFWKPVLSTQETIFERCTYNLSRNLA